MENTINQRVNQVISALKISKTDFATKANMPYQTLINIIGERQTKPSYEAIEKILTNFDNINPDWLLVGRGEMFKDSPPKREPESISSQVLEELRAVNEKVNEQAQKVSEQAQMFLREIQFLKSQLQEKDTTIHELTAILGKH
jgi:hypothetical protein